MCVKYIEPRDTTGFEINLNEIIASCVVMSIGRRFLCVTQFPSFLLVVSPNR